MKKTREKKRKRKSPPDVSHAQRDAIRTTTPRRKKLVGCKGGWKVARKLCTAVLVSFLFHQVLRDSQLGKISFSFHGDTNTSQHTTIRLSPFNVKALRFDWKVHCQFGFSNFLCAMGKVLPSDFFWEQRGSWQNGKHSSDAIIGSRVFRIFLSHRG